MTDAEAFAAKLRSPTSVRCFWLGYRAALDGKASADCPWKLYSQGYAKQRRLAWQRGHYFGTKELNDGRQG